MEPPFETTKPQTPPVHEHKPSILSAYPPEKIDELLSELMTMHISKKEAMQAVQTTQAVPELPERKPAVSFIGEIKLPKPAEAACTTAEAEIPPAEVMISQISDMYASIGKLDQTTKDYLISLRDQPELLAYILLKLTNQKAVDWGNKEMDNLIVKTRDEYKVLQDYRKSSGKQSKILKKIEKEDKLAEKKQKEQTKKMPKKKRNFLRKKK